MVGQPILQSAKNGNRQFILSSAIKFRMTILLICLSTDIRSKLAPVFSAQKGRSLGSTVFPSSFTFFFDAFLGVSVVVGAL